MNYPEYLEFLATKSKMVNDFGFAPSYVPDKLFPFQKTLVEWATRMGRSAIFADCGLGKTFMQLTWAENVVQKTNGRVLILTPLSVSYQTVGEADKLGVEVSHRREGLRKKDRIVVTNYGRLHYFNPRDFVGVVCDESSILKNFNGKTRKAITDFMSGQQYRLLCTATAAPNDYMELGTSSEALGVMLQQSMLARFFTHDGGDTSKWRLKGHVKEHLFWQWICSWARAMRKPSDMGFDDNGFILPPLKTNTHIVEDVEPNDGFLIEVPAVGLDAQRKDLRKTLEKRCALVADIANSHSAPVVCWTNLNCEADLLAKKINGAVNVQGSDTDERKESAFRGFSDGSIRVMITKPSIGGFGLNWQHCPNVTFFPSHSYEQYYQCVRRCWRFGQKNHVTVDMITTPAQENVLKNIEKKAKQSSIIFDRIVKLMREELSTTKEITYKNKEQIPAWLLTGKR